jgi:hypothetical protein
MRRTYHAVVGCVIAALGGIAAGCGESDTAIPLATPPRTPTATATPTPTGGVFVFWDQNEEEDALTPSGGLEQLIPPWDPNGQMCILPDGSGRFVVGYNPTLPGQHNPGSLLPVKNPPVGLELCDRNGNFTGHTIYVPGPYALPGSDIGGDIPPDEHGTYNDNGSFTGCAVDSAGHLFAADIGQAQGTTSSPDQGRIIEWFPPDYAPTDACIIVGPTQGGVGPHHVNGTGGLRNPGLMAVDPADNLYVPESGNARVIKFDHSVIPSGPQDCPGNVLDPPAHFQVFARAGIPAGIARDPSCSTATANCWAVTNILSSMPPPLGGGAAINWVDDTGHLTHVKGPVPAGAYSPFGVAVGPTGDVFFVDIALRCDDSGCGTLSGQGGVFKVSFTPDGQPSAPQQVAGGMNFPTSVTVCDSSTQVCPEPLPAAATPTPCGACTPTPTPVCGQTGAACSVGEECCSGQCIFGNQCQ